MSNKKVDKHSWSIPKRVKLYEEALKSPLEPQVLPSKKKKSDPIICHVTKQPHNYEEIDRWQWSTMFKNWSGNSPDAIHITEQCADCGKKRHRHDSV